MPHVLVPSLIHCRMGPKRGGKGKSGKGGPFKKTSKTPKAGPALRGQRSITGFLTQTPAGVSSSSTPNPGRIQEARSDQLTGPEGNSYHGDDEGSASPRPAHSASFPSGSPGGSPRSPSDDLDRPSFIASPPDLDGWLLIGPPTMVRKFKSGSIDLRPLLVNQFPAGFKKTNLSSLPKEDVDELSPYRQLPIGYTRQGERLILMGPGESLTPARVGRVILEWMRTRSKTDPVVGTENAWMRATSEDTVEAIIRVMKRSNHYQVKLSSAGYQDFARYLTVHQGDWLALVGHFGGKFDLSEGLKILQSDLRISKVISGSLHLGQEFKNLNTNVPGIVGISDECRASHRQDGDYYSPLALKDVWTCVLRPGNTLRESVLANVEDVDAWGCVRIYHPELKSPRAPYLRTRGSTAAISLRTFLGGLNSEEDGEDSAEEESPYRGQFHHVSC